MEAPALASGVSFYLRLSTRAVLLALLGAASPACHRSAEPAPASEASVAPLLEEESQLADYLRVATPRLGSSRAEIAARLGEPDSIAGTTVANRHDPSVTDSIFTLYYVGLTAVVYKAGYDGKEILASLVITDPQHVPADAPLGIGATADEVRELLGEPDGTATDYLEFTCEECLIAGHETVRFVLRASTVARIELQYWID
jgi:hypothetical protein